jgi:branched-chain amino acid transport system permease protein
MTRAVSVRLAAGAAVTTLVLVLPTLVSEFRAFQLAYAGAYFIAVSGLVVLTGHAGQISLGHGAFVAVGAYTTAILVADHGVDPLATIPAAGAAAGVAGLALGLPALRLSGLYLALVTFSLAVVTPAVLKRAEGVTGGSAGIVLDQPRAPWGLDLAPERWLYYLAWGLGALLAAVAWLVLRGRVGRALRALRDSEVAAASSGVSLPFYKTLAFGVSAFYAGIAGSLLAMGAAFVSPDTFPVSLSIALLVGAVVGGLGSLPGAVAGAFFVQYLPTYAQEISQTAPSVIYGAAVVLVVILAPNGLAGLVDRARRALASIL